LFLQDNLKRFLKIIFSSSLFCSEVGDERRLNFLRAIRGFENYLEFNAQVLKFELFFVEICVAKKLLLL
jgi:hypothetical protein